LINVGGWQIFSAFGIDNLTSGRAVLVGFTMPVWASLAAAVLLGEALTRRLLAALVLGMAGVGVLLVGDYSALGATPLGVVYMLAAAFSWGLGIVLLKRVRWQIPTLPLTAWQLLIAGTVIAAASWAMGEARIPELSPLAWSMLVFVLLIPICFCTYAFFRVVSLFPANISAIGTLMIPVVGVVSGSLVLGEPIGWRELLSLALIGSAMVLTLLFPVRR
jgi:drug/metabolite transporter (DMT)-like permease